jgi:hypothetical protein
MKIGKVNLIKFDYNRAKFFDLVFSVFIFSYNRELFSYAYCLVFGHEKQEVIEEWMKLLNEVSNLYSSRN